MHTFQPYPIDLLEFNPFSKIGKEWFLITAGDEEKVNTMTASWGGMGVIWGKNVVYIFVRDSRYTKEFLDKQDTFSITFFNSDQKSALKYLGAVSGRDEDKIANARMHIQMADGTPFLDEGTLVLLCKKLSATKIEPEHFLDIAIDETWYKDKDYHTMYIGEITQILAR